jgi:hypothetical protein
VALRAIEAAAFVPPVLAGLIVVALVGFSVHLGTWDKWRRERRRRGRKERRFRRKWRKITGSKHFWLFVWAAALFVGCAAFIAMLDVMYL